MVGPAGLSPRAALAGLVSGEGPAGVIVRDIRLPRTLLAALIGATLGLSGAALQGLLRNPLAEPALFGAPQAAAAAAALVIAFGFAPVTSFAVPVAGILGATISIGGLLAIAGRRASLTVTLLAGLALASFAGAALMLAADVAIRLGPSVVEIKLGVVTALIGVPVFLAIIFRERRLLEGAPA